MHFEEDLQGLLREVRFWLDPRFRPPCR
jgi:hypothetical protein